MTTADHRSRSAEKIEAAQAVLADQIAALVNGDDWRRYLALQSKLHAYSANNVMLIAAQHAKAFDEGHVSTPEPTCVAGFYTWKALGRVVQKGQHGYTILAPVQRMRRTATDPDGSVRILGKGDEPVPGETEQRRPVLRGFRVEYVFDASQTEGANLPDPPTPRLLEGDAPPGLAETVIRLIEQAGFEVHAVADASCLGGANGQTRFDTHTVAVRADMDDAAIAKTLIHEAAHVLLHAQPPGRLLPRPLKEVEAESVAFVVGFAHGMATDDYSFPYVATWAGERVARAVIETQARVAAAAKTILEASPAEHGSGGKLLPGVEMALRPTHRLDRPLAGLNRGVGAPSSAAPLDPQPVTAISPGVC